MQTVKDKLIGSIKELGSVNGDIIKVDRFLNHMVDVALLKSIANEIIKQFADYTYNKILTVEASGLVLASFISFVTDKPFVFVKKKKPITMSEFYSAESYSFTKKEVNTLYVSAEVISKEDKILFVDDFYAHGSTLKATEKIIDQIGAEIVASAVIINKSDNNSIFSILDKEDLVNLL
jgi:xanthine phosphoribosyltransferase